jgi:hypothetical protein
MVCEDPFDLEFGNLIQAINEDRKFRELFKVVISSSNVYLCTRTLHFSTKDCNDFFVIT